MSQHSPGPWIAIKRPADTKGKSKGMGQIHICQRNSSSSLATMYWSTSMPDAMDADARLLASAPDLLAACHSFIAIHRPLPGETGPSAEAYAKAKAAIDKATGAEV